MLAVLLLFAIASVDDPIVAVAPDHAPISYAKEIADILTSKCVGCHNAGDLKGSLSLEDVPAMLKGGKRGPAIVSGDSSKSRLVQMAGRRAEPFMPPVDSPEAPRLTNVELGLIEQWINEGAQDDSADASATAAPAEIGTLPASFRPIVAVDISEDGSRVVAGRGNIVEVYDADTGLRMHTFVGPPGLVDALRLSRDGHYLAAGTYGAVTLWTCPTVKASQTFAGHKSGVRAMAVSGDGAIVVSGGADKTLRTWNAADGKARTTAELPSEIQAVSVSPAGALAAAGCADGFVRVFDNGERLRAEFQGTESPINAIAFTPDGAVVSASEDGSCRIWALPASADFASAQAPLHLTGHEGAVNGLVVFGDGVTIATAGADGTLRLWNRQTGALNKTIDVGMSNPKVPLTALTLDSTRQVLWVGLSDGRAVSCSPASGQILKTHKLHSHAVRSLTVSADSRRLLSGDSSGAIVVWDLELSNLELVFAHPAPKRGDPLKPITGIAALPNGQIITSADSETMRAWSVEGDWRHWRTLDGLADRVLAIDFNPDGTLIAAGAGEPTRGGQVRIWETGKGLLIRELESAHSDSVFGVKFSPDGTRIATASADKLVKLFDVYNGRELRSMEGHTHHALSVDWSADGKQVVSAGADAVLKFWDVETGEAARTSEPISKQISAVVWPRGPGTPVVATASGDRNVRFWNPRNAQVTRTFEGPSDFLYGVALSSDRSRVAAGGADGTLFIWNGADARVLHKIAPQSVND